MKRASTLGLAALLVGTLFSLNLPSGSGTDLGGSTVYWGERIILGAEDYENGTVVVDGNITIMSGGNLTFTDIMLVMNVTFDGEYTIRVGSGGELNLVDSNIASGAFPFAYNFHYMAGSSGSIVNTTIESCGHAGGSYGIEVSTSDLTVANSSVQNSYAGLTYIGVQATVSNSFFLNNARNGVTAYDAADVTILNSNLSWNGNNGISVFNDATATIEGNEILGNTGEGVFFMNNAVGTIRGNFISGSQRRGIALWDDSHALIENNIVQGSIYPGIALITSDTIGSNATIRNTTIRNNGYDIAWSYSGIYVYSDPYSPVLDNNTFFGNAWAGIEVDSSRVTVFDSTLGQDSYGVYVYGNGSAEITNSSISSTSWDLVATENCTITTLNTTFDPASAYAFVNGEVVVQNYLHVLVENSTQIPVMAADVQVTDNGLAMYATSGFGGSDPQTNTAGRIDYIAVTDRIYIGPGSSATENVTVLEVSKGNMVFGGIPRTIDMSSSHQEIVTATFDGDTTPPAMVQDLIVTDVSVDNATLNWTAPGDDGDLGTASAYDIRFSTELISDLNWDAAIQAAGEPAPQPAGQLESFIVTGLSQGTTYYFAIKTADEIPNWSELSNVASGTTKETVPPSISDLLVDPLPQEVNGWVNVSAIVLDATGVDQVRIDIDTVGNWSMAYDSSSGRYYINLEHNNVSVFYFNISAVDIYGNWAKLGGQIVIQDTTDPDISHTPIVSVMVGETIEIEATVTDNYQIDSVKLNFTDVDGTSSNETMSRSGDIYSFQIPAQVSTGAVTYFIWAQDTEGNVAMTGVHSVDITPDTLSPSAPTIELVTSGEGTLSLTWTAPTTNTDGSSLTDLAGYNVYRMTSSGGERTLVSDVLVVTTEYEDTGLEDGKTYYYVVRAVDENGNESPDSNEALGTTESVAQPDWIWIILSVIVILIVLVLIVLLLWRRGRTGIEEESEEPPLIENEGTL